MASTGGAARRVGLVVGMSATFVVAACGRIGFGSSIDDVTDAELADAGSTGAAMDAGAGVGADAGRSDAGSPSDAGTSGGRDAGAVDAGTMTGDAGRGGAGPRATLRRFALGFYHTCLTQSDGTVSCWGDETGGQLGRGVIGTGGPLMRTVSLGPSSEVTAISGFAYGSCALLESRAQIRCWGRNDTGDLGDGAMTHETCGAVDCASTPTTVSLPELPTSDAGPSSGAAHTCIVAESGNVLCWGTGLFGQLGDGNTSWSSCPSSSCSALPVDVDLGGRARSVGVGARFSCAVLDDGHVRCWGENLYGQLGSASAGDTTCGASSSPCRLAPTTDVSGITNAVLVDGGDDFACALLSTGDVDCWGSDSVGQLGDGPGGGVGIVRVSLPSAARELAVGGQHACAVLVSGSVYCWGSNDHGQLGIGSMTSRDTPALLPPFGTVVQLGAGAYHSCGLESGGAVFCWGYNSNGQLGSAMGLGTSVTSPTRVTGT